MFLNHDGWGILRHCGEQQLGTGSQSLGSKYEPQETALQTQVAPGPDLHRVSCSRMVVPGFGLRVIWMPALGDCVWCPFSVVLEGGGRGQTLASWGPLRTLGCSINEFLKTIVGWDKAQHTLSVKGCVLVC